MSKENFFHLIQQRFPKDSDKVFLAGPGFETFYYRDIEPLTAKIANLFNEIGLAPGARVVAQIPKSPMAVMLYLACLRSGIIFTPLNTAYTVDEMDYFLGDAAPALLVCSPDNFEGLMGCVFKHGISSVLELDEKGHGSLTNNISTISSEHKVANLSSTDIAVIIYTSGTTGKPKGAMLSHGNLAANALSLYELWDWQTDDVLIHALPIFHVHGLFVALHLALLGGSTMAFLAKFDAREILKQMPHSTVLMGVPTFYTRLLNEKSLNKDACRHMRLFISGSAPLLEETFEHFQTQTDHTIVERYGMSETGMLTSNPLNGERVAGTVGFPLPEVSIRIRDDNDQEVAEGQIGMLQVKGPNVFQGYWRKPELTEKEHSDGYFITGDLVQRDDAYRIRIVGRNSDMIISGGYNVYPKEIELVLDELEGVLESAVFGVPHFDLGEAVVAVIVANGNTGPDLDTLSLQMQDSLAKFKIPKRFYLLKELPRNTMGKVQKKQLREDYNSCFDAGN